MTPAAPPPGGLNENHLRRLYATCGYVDKLLVSIEGVLNVSESDALFHRYRQVLPPAARAGIVEGIRQFRASIVETLARHGIGLPAPSGDPAFAIRKDLQFVDDALEELLPSNMTGYGLLSAEAAADLEHVVGDLRLAVSRLQSMLDAERRDQLNPGGAADRPGQDAHGARDHRPGGA